MNTETFEMLYEAEDFDTWKAVDKPKDDPPSKTFDVVIADDLEDCDDQYLVVKVADEPKETAVEVGVYPAGSIKPEDSLDDGSSIQEKYLARKAELDGAVADEIARQKASTKAKEQLVERLDHGWSIERQKAVAKQKNLLRTPHGEAVIAGARRIAMSENLNPDIVRRMHEVASVHFGNPDSEPQEGMSTNYDDDTFAEHEVFLLEREKEFKYGKGREVLAISDGGKNRWDKAVKYVKYFYLYENNGKMKANDKTYTYSHEKAAEMWKTKVAEGFNRVI